MRRRNTKRDHLAGAPYAPARRRRPSHRRVDAYVLLVEYIEDLTFAEQGNYDTRYGYTRYDTVISEYDGCHLIHLTQQVHSKDAGLAFSWRQRRRRRLRGRNDYSRLEQLADPDESFRRRQGRKGRREPQLPGR